MVEKNVHSMEILDTFRQKRKLMKIVRLWVICLFYFIQGFLYVIEIDKV